MATGLFNRHAGDKRSANDQTADAAVADERAAAQERQADADRDRATATAEQERTGTTGRGGRVFGRARHPLATDQPVPPGGAVAPLERAGDETTTVQNQIEMAEREREEAQREADVARRQVRRMHTSFAATLSLIIGVCAVLGALSGRLAPVAVAAGVLGLLFAAAALVAVSRRTVTGHHVALFGLVFSIAGIVLGILAINKTASWLNVDVDQAGRLRDWLNSELSWLKRW